MIKARITKRQFIHVFRQVRSKLEELSNPLVINNEFIQGEQDIGALKWYLAHTTWFFENIVLIPKVTSYKPFRPLFQQIFGQRSQVMNIAKGAAMRMLVSPSLTSIYHYRHYVDKAVIQYVSQISKIKWHSIRPVLLFGLHYEQQHQERLLMDVKHALSQDPDCPAYRQRLVKNVVCLSKKMEFVMVPGGKAGIGHKGRAFCFNNELPRHEVLIRPYLLALRLVTNEEYLDFMEAGGYQHSNWWHSAGWDCVQYYAWKAPLYWRKLDGDWYEFTLSGLQKLNPFEPVSHVSCYEAGAYARWRNLRLPTEMEWEHYVALSRIRPEAGNFMESQIYHPQSLTENTSGHAQQLFGDLWEWTASAHLPYPGYKPASNRLEGYDSRFMPGQYVLRGGCCVTPESHIRTSYRNFFQPEKRRLFSGIRLAGDI